MIFKNIDFHNFSKNKVLLNIISSLTIIGFWGFPFNLNTYAETIRLGVVKSEDNSIQWEEINSRLQGLNIDYCTLELSQLPQNLAINELNTLFFPNIKTWDHIEARSLENWVNQGNKVIVSGEIASNSAPAVKNLLRSLLGAYWGFPLTSHSSLRAVKLEQKNWLSTIPVTENIKGGVVIPFGLNSHTAAIWDTSASLPAIVINDNSVFIGWEWGNEEMTTQRVDQEWLKGILNHYGTLPPLQNKTGISCDERIVEETEENTTNDNLNIVEETQENTLNIVEETQENITNDTLEIAGLNDQTQVNTTAELPITGKPIEEYSPEIIIFDKPQENFSWKRRLLVKTEELKGLISRFESAILTAQAYANMEENLEEENNENTSENLSKSIVEEAKKELNIALELIEKHLYEEAEIKLLITSNNLLENYPSDHTLAQPEIRYVWLDRGTIVKAKSEEDLIPLFDKFAQAGINIVFLETLNAGYTIYPSEIAPKQNPLIEDWDPLESAVKLAHERGMELHPWLWIFATANQLHNQILNQPENYLGPVLSENPEWIMTNNEGDLFHPTSQKAFLDPANPEVRSYLLSIFDEIITKYDVDGIQFDYIRYPFQHPSVNQTHGYGLSSREQFFKQTGVDPLTLNPDSNLWQKWTEFRIQQIDSFVAIASQRLKQKRPNLIISTAVFPISYNERINKIQQNWEEWINQGYIDLLLPMTYAENSGELQQLIEPVFKENLTGSTLILPGIKIQNQSEKMVLDQVQLVRNLSTLGYGLFAAESFNDNIYETFRNTQGNSNLTTNQEQIFPHRQPFETIIKRYKILQHEWNFWLIKQELNIEETLLQQWQDSQDKLIERFEKLASEPTIRNLLLTQVELDLFKNDFHKWMKDYQEINSYQVEIWNHRLLALEKLLQYGEKFTME